MPKNTQAPAFSPEMAQRMQQMVSQGYGQLQQSPAFQARQRLGNRDPQAVMGAVGAGRNPQAIMDAARAKRGMQPIDWAARQAAMQAKAEAIANALRQQQEAQAAAQDPNSPANPNAQFALAMAQGNSGKNQPPPQEYGGLVGGGN